MRIIILIISLLSFSAISQINFFEEYAGVGNDFGQGVIQLEDSSYVITGGSSSFSGGQTDVFLLCIDSMGQYKWSTYFGADESDWGRRVMHIENYGYYVAGYSNSNVGNGFDFYLVKTDDSGIPQWQRYYGGSNWEKVYDAALTRDSGVIMVGDVESEFEGTNAYIVRTDKNGDTLWTRTVATSGEDFARSVTQWNDSIFVVAGQIYVEDSLMNKGLLYCIKDDGTLLWMDSVGVNGNTYFNDVIIWGDTLQGVGAVRMDVNDDWDMWRATYLLADKQLFFPGIHENNLGDYIAEGFAVYGWNNTRIIGQSRLNELSYPGGEDLHFANQNDFLWNVSPNIAWVARDGQDELGEMISTSDGGVMAVGYTSSRIGVFSNWVFAIKFGPNNAIPWQDEVGPVLPLVGQNELNLFAGISIYPNPVEEQLTLSSEKSSMLLGSITDIAGNEVSTFLLEGNLKLNISNLSSGIYIIRLLDPETGAVFSDRITKL